MYSLRTFERPGSVAQVLAFLELSNKNVILGGGHWLRLGSRAFDAGLDLSYIPGYQEISLVSGADKVAYDPTSTHSLERAGADAQERSLHLGAGVSYGVVEDLPWVRAWMSGVLTRALYGIVSKQMRNTATLGGSVFSRFAFSDSIPVLLVCGARVQLASAGWMSVEELMAASPRDLKGDFMLTLALPAQTGRAAYEAVRVTANDFPLVNVAVSYIDTPAPNGDGALGAGWHVAVGARPAAAVLAPQASRLADELLAQGGAGLSEKDVAAAAKRVAEALVEEVKLGSGGGASGEYRASCVRAMAARLIAEVCHAG